MKTIIYTHKNFLLPPLKNTETIVLGLGEVELDRNNISANVIYESSYDNRLEPQYAYSELAGLHCVALNLDIDDEDVVNLAHYRRYLSASKNEIDISPFARELANYTFIVPKRTKLFLKTPVSVFDYIFKRSYIEEHYEYNHIKEDWAFMIEVLKSEFPNSHNEIEKFSKLNYFIPYNIFCAKHRDLKKYYNWLLVILNKLAFQIKPMDHAYQGRVFGFMGERLFTFYLLLNGLKFKEVEIINF